MEIDERKWREYELNTREELRENPSLKNQIRGKNLFGLIEDRNEAQKINTYDFTDKWGRKGNSLDGCVKVNSNIIKLPSNNFGSLASYYIDTLPIGIKFMKGQEITFISQRDRICKGRAILNRRALSRMVATWGYLNGIRYYKGKSNTPRHDTAIGLCCVRQKINGKEYDLISGIEATHIIKDIKRHIREGNPKCFYEYRLEVNQSSEADEIVVLTINRTPEFKEKYQDKKGNWRWKLVNSKVINASEKVKYNKYWRFPRYSVEYLNGLLEELHNGDYFVNLYVPVIYNLYKYPIKCTGIREVSYAKYKDVIKARNEYEQAVIDNLQYGD
jgi:hypothetical protein